MRTLLLLVLFPGLALAAPPRARVALGTLRPPLAVSHRTLPDYPKAARMRFVEGDVLVTARVSPGGVVDQIEVREGEPVLVDAARAAVRDWRDACSRSRASGAPGRCRAMWLGR